MSWIVWFQLFFSFMYGLVWFGFGAVLKPLAALTATIGLLLNKIIASGN
jgi:hypothetical protein